MAQHRILPDLNQGSPNFKLKQWKDPDPRFGGHRIAFDGGTQQPQEVFKTYSGGATKPQPMYGGPTEGSNGGGDPWYVDALRAKIPQFVPGQSGYTIGNPGSTPVPEGTPFGSYDFGNIQAEVDQFLKNNSSQWEKAGAEYNPATGKFDFYRTTMSGGTVDASGRPIPVGTRTEGGAGGFESYIAKKLALATGVPGQGEQQQPQQQFSSYTSPPEVQRAEVSGGPVGGAVGGMTSQRRAQLQSEYDALPSDTKAFLGWGATSASRAEQATMRGGGGSAAPSTPGTVFKTTPTMGTPVIGGPVSGGITGGGTTGGGTGASQPTPDFGAMGDEDKSFFEAFSKYINESRQRQANIITGAPTVESERERLYKELVEPTLSSEKKLRTLAENLNISLEQLPSDTARATQDFLVTEAQRRRRETQEREPLMKQLATTLAGQRIATGERESAQTRLESLMGAKEQDLARALQAQQLVAAPQEELYKSMLERTLARKDKSAEGKQAERLGAMQLFIQRRQQIADTGLDLSVEAGNEYAKRIMTSSDPYAVYNEYLAVSSRQPDVMKMFGPKAKGGTGVSPTGFADDLTAALEEYKANQTSPFALEEALTYLIGKYPKMKDEIASAFAGPRKDVEEMIKAKYKSNE